jgi:hypothetical protein
MTRPRALPAQNWLWLPDSFDWRRRFIDQAYLLAEVVSSTDDDRIVETGERWIDARVRLYKAHPHCEAVLVIEQRRPEATLRKRTSEGRTVSALMDMGDEIVLLGFGLRCTLGDMYANTSLRPRPIRGPGP